MGRMITAGPDARSAGDAGASLPEAVERLPRQLTGWAMRRSLAPNSATGISLALSLCAAVWFSSGSRADSIKGALALGAAYLAWRVSRGLTDPAAGRMTGAGLAGTDLMAEICGALAEFAVYAGLAVAGYAAHWGNTWIVAIVVVIVIAVRRTITACRTGIGAPPAANVDSPPSAPGDARVWGLGYLLGRALWGLVTVSPGWRFAVIAVAVPAWGAHTALLILLDWEIIATGYALAGPGPRHAAGPAEPAGLGVPRATASRAARAGAPDLLVPSGLAEPPDPVVPPLRPGSPLVASASGSAATAEKPLALAGPAEPALIEPALIEPALIEPALIDAVIAEPAVAEPTMTLDQMIHEDLAAEPEPEPQPEPDPDPAPAVILACRDDGVAAVWLGQVVRGQFVPLPPAVAGLAATCFLAVLGLRNLPGILLLTPLVVMLLAAPGNAHPHDGRLDWLVPAVLLAGQFVYVAALGFSFRIPTAVTFALCSAVALRYLDLTTRDPGEGQIPDTRLGWEGRMLAIGLGAMFGIGMIAFLAMTAYLGLLICGNVTASCLAGRERT
jgi:hypothetical protein